MSFHTDGALPPVDAVLLTFCRKGKGCFTELKLSMPVCVSVCLCGNVCNHSDPKRLKQTTSGSRGSRTHNPDPPAPRRVRQRLRGGRTYGHQHEASGGPEESFSCLHVYCFLVTWWKISLNLYERTDKVREDSQLLANQTRPTVTAPPSLTCFKSDLRGRVTPAGLSRNCSRAS